MLKITVLGCGASLGTPIIGCNCDICGSTSKYNKRTRSSIYVNNQDSAILVDFGFDIKYQLIREKIIKLDAAILTHNHADHVSGIDNLRVFPFIQNKPLNIFTDKITASQILVPHSYLFAHDKLIMNEVGFFDKIKIGSLDIQFFSQNHYRIDSLGIRINNFVYSCDVLYFYEESKKYLKNIDHWILDCTGYTKHHTHASLETVLKLNEEFKPKNLYLTNMGHEIDYHKITEILPNNIKPLYDSYKIICD